MGALAILGDPPALTLHLASKLVAKPVTWTVDQLIPSGMLTVLSGKDKSGKTLLAWEMVRAVLNGEPFLEQFSVANGPVIFLALDDPTVVTIDRLQQLGINDSPDLHVATPLDSQNKHYDFWKAVTAEARLIRPQLIVVDALYLFLEGGGESLNQAGAMARVMQPLNELAEETGASVLLITHDTKSGSDVAGSFVIRAAAKQILRLEGKKEEPSSRTLHIDGKLIEQCLWTFKFEGPGKWALSDEEDLNLAQTRADVTKWLQAGNRGTAVSIAEVIRRRPATVRMVLTRAVEEGLVLQEKVKHGVGRPAIEFRWNFSPGPVVEEAGRKIIEKGSEPLTPIAD
jgi:archaellum biogenesis ATPase FlaH